MRFEFLQRRDSGRFYNDVKTVEIVEIIDSYLEFVICLPTEALAKVGNLDFLILISNRNAAIRREFFESLRHCASFLAETEDADPLAGEIANTHGM